MELPELIDFSLEKKHPDIVLKNGRIVDVVTGLIDRGDVTIANGIIVGMYDRYDGKINIDLRGKYILPGFIEGHIHIESSMLSVSEFLASVLAHGTTTVVADPHEIANVLGVRGIELMLKESEDLPVDLYSTIPSCVPATTLETSGAKIGIPEIRGLLKNPKIIGLGEVMNYPGVIGKDKEVLKKIKATGRGVLEGHAPMLAGKDLSAYIIAGMGSDHECTEGTEAMEKLRKGMRVMVREGSAAKNLEMILGYFMKNGIDFRHCMFVSDDIHPSTILAEGHLDRIARKAVRLGLSPMDAVRMITLNPAQYFGLTDRGRLAVGKRADIVVVNSLKSFDVQTVISSGKIAFDDNRLMLKTRRCRYDEKVLNSVKLKRTARASDFGIKSKKAVGSVDVKVIGVTDGSILTKKIEASMKVRNFEVQPNLENDVIKVAVVERHHRTGRCSVAFAKGLGLKEGAFASSIAHDSHNIIVAGTDGNDMAVAVNHLSKIGGGLVVTKKGKVVGSLQLTIAGLMSTGTARFVDEKLGRLHAVLKSMGCRLESPFTTLSFICLPVIPKLKITDKGLVEDFKLTNLIIK